MILTGTLKDSKLLGVAIGTGSHGDNVIIDFGDEQITGTIKDLLIKDAGIHLECDIDYKRLMELTEGKSKIGIDNSVMSLLIEPGRLVIKYLPLAKVPKWTDGAGNTNTRRI